MTTRTLPNGSIFAERYRILRRIGGGGMGDVYEVLHLETNRHRALKVVQAHVLTNSGMCERFRREAKITAGIESEFLVDVIDAGVDEATGLPFLVMELLRGEELKNHLKRASRLSPTEVVFFLHQAALALDKTHKAGIVHRDLKPDNLFLTQREDGSPRLKVLDFGIAKLLAGEGANPYATREMMGTPFYMAPEQFNLDRPVSAAADIYSIGMIAYTLLVGAPYWKDEPAAANALMFAAVAGNGPQVPASIRARRRGVPLPSAFDAWFARVAAVDPEDRYPTALLAVDALADALGVHRAGQTGLPASSPRAAPPPPNPPRPFGATLPMNPRPSMPYSPPAPAPSAPGASAPRASAPYASPPGAFAPRPSAPRPSSPRAPAPRPSVPRASAPRPSAPRPSAPRPSAPRASGWPAVGVIVRTGPQKAETDTFTNSLSSAKTIPVGAAARDRRIALIAGLVGILLTLGVTVFLLVSRATVRAGEPEARLTSNQAIPGLRDVPRPKPPPPPPGDAAPEASPPAPSASPSAAPPKPAPKPPPKTTGGAKPSGAPAPSPTPKGPPQQSPRTKPKTGLFGF